MRKSSRSVKPLGGNIPNGVIKSKKALPSNEKRFFVGLQLFNLVSFLAQKVDHTAFTG